jgi:hypothetical protein
MYYYYTMYSKVMSEKVSQEKLSRTNIPIKMSNVQHTRKVPVSIAASFAANILYILFRRRILKTTEEGNDGGVEGRKSNKISCSNGSFLRRPGFDSQSGHVAGPLV